MMSKSHKATIWPEFYTEGDKDFLAELVTDWLLENGWDLDKIEQLGWEVSIEWEESGG
jgi:hypothetical protein